MDKGWRYPLCLQRRRILLRMYSYLLAPHGTAQVVSMHGGAIFQVEIPPTPLRLRHSRRSFIEDTLKLLVGVCKPPIGIEGIKAIGNGFKDGFHLDHLNRARLFQRCAAG